MRKESFLQRLYECNQHKRRLLIAKKRLSSLMPLDVQRYENLKDEEMSFIDQFIFRFSKLQDTMGERLFSSFLELSGEEIKSKTFIDRLNRLEELGLVERDEWLELRRERNEVAHEYSFNVDDVVESINRLYDVSERLIAIYDHFYARTIEIFDFVKEAKIDETEKR